MPFWWYLNTALMLVSMFLVVIACVTESEEGIFAFTPIMIVTGFLFYAVDWSAL